MKEKIAVDLALRDSARDLFETIESSKYEKIVVDFSSIRSISRSFAQEYCTRRKMSSKDIREVHVPITVKKMFAVVKAPRVKKKVFKARAIEAVSL